jgi:hypothetical protein
MNDFFKKLKSRMPFVQGLSRWDSLRQDKKPKR